MTCRFLQGNNNHMRVIYQTFMITYSRLYVPSIIDLHITTNDNVSRQQTDFSAHVDIVVIIALPN